MPATLTEVLEPSKTSPAAIRWTPGEVPGCGTLRIDQRRASVTYLVYAIDAVGDRAFRLQKPDGEPGTDEEAGNYDVRCGPSGEFRGCECRGWLRWRTPCKHMRAVAAIIQNGWL